MKKVFGKSIFFAVISIILMFVIRTLFHTENYLSDIGGIQSFLGVFGTLYGIMAAFIVVEVWNEFNTTNCLIEKEALGFEKLYNLSLYFRDHKFEQEMKKTIKDNIQLAASGFKDLGEGRRNREYSLSFREIAKIIREVKFNDDHDSTIFTLLIEEYNALSQIRIDRINQCLTRLPPILKVFLYVSSVIVLLSFLTMPFANQIYGYMAVGFLTFILTIVVYLVEDLDNPFTGYWNVSSEPFQRVMKHIEEDY